MKIVNSKKDTEFKKHMKKLVELEKVRKEKKTTKQKSKDTRKQRSRRNKMTEEKEENVDKKEEEVSRTPTNLKAVPENCRHLVNNDDIVYAVPGDGACYPNCSAAHLFQDEVFGPNLRKRMNTFFVEHYYRKYQYICPCSKETPFVRQTKNGLVKFTDIEQLFIFLLSSNYESVYMWSDSVDLAVISDMYQLKIKVITTRGSEDKAPTVNWVYPDEKMKQFAELKDVEQNDMVLLHEDDLHFNLIISKYSVLAKFGSLSYRFNFGSANNKKQDIVEEEGEEFDKDGGDKDVISLKEMKKELKNVKDEKKKIHLEYINCEKELRKKTEEVEI